LTCLKEDVYPQTIPYTAEIKYEGRLHQINVPNLTIPQCRACGSLVFNDSADDQMLQAFRSQLKLLTPQQIKEGRKTLGLKSKELAERLGVAAATVSRWEKRMLIQSRAMDNLLRVYFAVPEARAVLRGAEQDPNLGVVADPKSDLAPVEARSNRVTAHFRPRELKNLSDQRKRQSNFLLNAGAN